ncbi:MAG: branched-chain-amino-acid transaminase [Armatimonadota bacterium]|nr:branched-chain-amino-acid transaminase [Armatimonadota bacterium]MDR5690170.1 branched-chain-amino-acid transaminase [Armatimonadota bacterium]MDR7387543.1 branched-chain-amino-acid transaminase [Armatimonadota bacterium]MDR7390319.1 branched-chain-amino-acid transaminase [Armatimonadota bacterium]MDR7391584.1 branched-chain-amino-acid transaminase [Armatimonadota bacterium]
MSGWTYVDGRFVPKEEASVSVYDHGFLYGDGVFEGIRVYGGRVFKLDEHVRRLYESAKSILLEIPIPPEEMKRLILEAVRRNGLQDAYVRPIVTRGRGDLGIDPRKCGRPTVVVIVDQIQLYPERAYREGLRMITATHRKSPSDSLNPRIKSLNYLNQILARLEANLAGADEALMLNHEGYVCECSADNVFVVRSGEVWTPPAHLGILRGVTRDAVLEIARDLGIPAFERTFTLHDVYTADEVFLTGTGAEIGPVVWVDGRVIGSGKPGPLTLRLLQAYRELTAREGTPVYEDSLAAPGGSG